MLPDRVSNPGSRTPDLRVRCLTNCATRPGCFIRDAKRALFFIEGSSDILDIRDLCMILIGYSGFLRYDELSKLKCCNVKIFDTVLVYT